MRMLPQPSDRDGPDAVPLAAHPGDDPFGDEVPPEDWQLAWPDPDFDRPAELAGLCLAELDELADDVPAEPAGGWPVSSFSRDGVGRGAGFAEGGVLDVLAPGVALAGFSDDAHASLSTLTDDELIGVLRAWRRQTSWAQARELAAAAELARRRPARRGPEPVSEFASDEIAVALTLTSVAAQHEVELALGLADRPAIAAALESGQLDLPRVKVILDGLAGLTKEHAAAVEAAVLPSAPAKTTGQLRAAIARAVFAVDPEAALRSRKTAQKSARVEYWIDTAGTGALSGRCLPPAEVLAADQRLCHIAKHWKRQGAIAGMDMLRARIYLALLLGQDVTAPPSDLLPPAFSDAEPLGDPGSGENSRYTAAEGGRAGSGPGRGHDERGPGAGRGRGSSGPGAGPGPGRGRASSGPGAGRGRGSSGPGAGRAGSAPGAGGAGPGTRPGSGRAAADSSVTPGSGRSWTGSPGVASDAEHEAGERQAPAGMSPGATDGASRPGAPAGLPPLAASVNLTVPLATLLGWSQSPGEAGKYGPLDAVTARQLVQASAGQLATRWHLTITDTHGRALAHGCAPRRSPGPAERWTFVLSTEPIARDECDHHNAEPGYRPSPRLTHLVRVRTGRCSFPGCRRQAATCDEDHTIPHDQDGLTCECNLSPLCRFHHRLKQSQGWTLKQLRPGVMSWVTPGERGYTTLPTEHPT